MKCKCNQLIQNKTDKGNNKKYRKIAMCTFCHSWNCFKCRKSSMGYAEAPSHYCKEKEKGFFSYLYVMG